MPARASSPRRGDGSRCRRRTPSSRRPRWRARSARRRAAGAAHARQSAAASANSIGVTSPSCPPISSSSRFSAEPFGLPRPCSSWKRKEIQSWRAFHASTGANTSTASTQATYGPGSRSRSRSEGRSTTASATESGKKIDVYFDANASPTQTPATDHQPSDAPERGGTLERAHDGVERDRLEGEQRRVRRGEHESRRGERHDRERERSEHRRACAGEAPRGRGGGERGHRTRQGPGRTARRRGVGADAEQRRERGAGADEHARSSADGRSSRPARRRDQSQ